MKQKIIEKLKKENKMEKVYYGVFLYEDEPAVLLANAESWDNSAVKDCHPLSKEVYSTMADIGVEYIEETLWGYFDGSEKKLAEKLKEAGFVFKEEVKEEGESILS